MRRVDWHYWQQFTSSVSNAVEALGSPDIVWYRGVTSADHTLKPSLLRWRNGLEKERTLFERFDQISRGAQLGPLREIEDWDILFQMQHFGVPTRLLDWSEVFGVAIFFATLGSPTDPYLYVLNPKKLNEKVGKTDLLGRWDRQTFGYRSVYWDGQPFKPSTPVAINPAHSNSRLAAQNGRFTVHGVDSRSLEDSVGDCIERVRIPLEAMDAAHEFLKMSGINEFSIFPDVDGAAPFLKNLVGLQRWP